jgi:flagellar hook-associated protein 3 FlgL
MRISTNTLYDAGVATMQRQTEGLLRTQQQIANGRRLLGPADDPVAAAHVLEIGQSQSLERQFAVNIGAAGDSLSLEETMLGNITRLLQDVRDITVQAGDPVLSANDRASLAADLSARYQELLALANSTDGTGQYLFAGYQGSTRPFSEQAGGNVVYGGDDGQRRIQVSASRQVAAGDPGSDVFLRIPTGNGSFATQAAPGNAGSAVIDSGTLLDPARWNGAGSALDFSIRFAVSAGSTTYDIVDNSSGNSLLTGLASGAAPLPRVFTPGANIDFSQAGPPAFDLGARVSIAGQPQDGDSFSVRTSTNQDVFRTIANLAGLLRSSAGTALTNGLVHEQRNLDNAMENILRARASAGVRLKELDSIKATGEERQLHYSETLSRLQDLDYAQAISDLTQQQVNLEAAQKSFAKVAGLSLFDFL